VGEEKARRVGEHLRGIPVHRGVVQRPAAGDPHGRAGGLRPAGDHAAAAGVRLREYEGLTTEEIHRERPDWELYRDGCPGGETGEQVAARMQTFLSGLAEVEGAVAIFAHGHVLRALAAVWADLDVTAAARLPLDTAAIGLLREGGRGRLIQRWNWKSEL